MGQPLLNLFLSKYEAIKDFQTLAMLLCIFSQEVPEIRVNNELVEVEKPRKKESIETVEKKMPAVKVQYPSDEEASEALSASVQPESLFQAMGQRYRSNSDVTPSLEEFSAIFSWYRKFSESTDGDQVDGPQQQQPLPTPSPPQPIKTTVVKDTSKSVVRKTQLDPEAEKRKIDSVLFLKRSDAKLSDYRELYADMLLRCDLHMKSAEILKKTEQSEDSPPAIFPYAKTCVKCANTFSGRKCFKCEVSSDNCVICDLRIRGLSAYCMNCGHGGHYKHVKAYFQEGPRPCPSGCGCNCILSMFD